MWNDGTREKIEIDSNESDKQTFFKFAKAKVYATGKGQGLFKNGRGSSLGRQSIFICI